MYAFVKLLMMIASIIATVVALWHRNKFPKLKFIFLYPLASFSQLVVSTIGAKMVDETNLMIDSITLNLFLLVEFLTIYSVYSTEISSVLTKRIYYLITTVYVATLTTNVFLFSGSLIKVEDIFLIQAILLIIPVGLYFVKQLLHPKPVALNKEPEFWVALGLLLYLGCTLPVFLLSDFIFDQKLGITIEKNVYAINDFFYAVLFLLIAKALSCKNEKAAKSY